MGYIAIVGYQAGPDRDDDWRPDRGDSAAKPEHGESGKRNRDRILPAHLPGPVVVGAMVTARA